MSMIARELREVWDALRANARHRNEALAEVRIRKLRGIWDLRFPFDYPVSVLAGPNGSGKSTVLFACACAYQVPGRGPRDFVPGNLFPDFTSRQPAVSSDATQPTEIEFHYLHHGERLSMVWKRGRTWKRSFTSRTGDSQPVRQVYLRTLANLTSPAEVRSILQLGRKPVRTETLDHELLILAHRVLPWRYHDLKLVSGQSTRDLLFAEVDDVKRTSYSEFHMSSGERTILRISKDISQLENALVLIDEVETGLHPYTQQQAMLELQRLALRRGLQIMVATHSAVVLDSVPPEARIFLDRDDATGQVRQAPPYRDIFQKALYGTSRDQLSILCEDVVAEGVIRGVLDVLNVELGLLHGDVVIGRNTGRNEFPGHISMLAKFDKLSGFILVLDGDSRAMEDKLRAVAEQHGHALQLLFLPGDGPPEQWLWDTVRKRPDEYAVRLGLTAADMQKSMHDLERLFNGAVQQQDVAKGTITALADRLERTVPDIARIVGQREAEKNAIPELLVALKGLIDSWRRL